MVRHASPTRAVNLASPACRLAVNIEARRCRGYSLAIASLTHPAGRKPSSMPAPTNSAEIDGLVPFDFDPRTRVVFGAGTAERLGELSREIGASRVLVVSDEGIARAGHVDRAVASLSAAGIESVVFTDVQSNPTTEDVERGLSVSCR